MASKKRAKPELVIAIPTVDEADNALAEIAGINRELAMIEVRMNETVDAAKGKAKSQAEPLAERKVKLEAGLQAFAEVNKASYFSDRKKTLDLTHGFMGYRLSTVISIVKDKTLALLKQFKYTDAIRTKESVDKDVLGTWPAAKLAQVKAKKESEDVFWYEIKQEEVKAE